MKLHTYTIPAETKFRSLTIDAAVQLTPDGFTADPATAADILAELAEAGGLTLGDWDAYGADGAERMLVWESEEAAADDDGSRALCQILREPATLPFSVAYSHSLADALYEGGCQQGKGRDFTVLEMGGGHGDCLILHTRKALSIWEALPKNNPDKCAVGYGAGTGMYIR